MTRGPRRQRATRIGSRSVVLLGAGLTALLLVGAAVNLLGSGGADEEAARPTAYRILYRVEQRVDDPPVVTWEERAVRRPFLGRSATFRERPSPVARPVSGVLTTTDRVYSLSVDGLQEVAGRVPGVAGGDQALAVVLEEAEARRLAMPEGTRRVAGRSCRLYRLARPHHQPLARPGGDDHADVCIDGDGLLLSEEWTLDGKIVLVRAAVEVDLSPPDAQLDELLSPVGASPPPPQLDPSIVEQGDPGESFLPAPAPPRGFDPAGVVKLVVPAAAASPDAPRGTILFTAVAWVFVRGPDVVTVEAGEGAPAWSAGDAAVRVQLPGLGPARSVLGPDGAELRMELGGRWVRVRGTVSPDRLLSYAAGLDGP